MNKPEPDRHSFIVKVWLETSEAKLPAPQWRGKVTHVPSGIYRYFHDIEEIVRFIRPFLSTVESRSSIRRRLNRLWALLKG